MHNIGIAIHCLCLCVCFHFGLTYKQPTWATHKFTRKETERLCGLLLVVCFAWVRQNENYRASKRRSSLIATSSERVLAKLTRCLLIFPCLYGPLNIACVCSGHVHTWARDGRRFVSCGCVYMLALVWCYMILLASQCLFLACEEFK